MHRKCIVRSCNSSHNLYRFPSLDSRNPTIRASNRKRLLKWMDSLGICEVKENYRICGKHFLNGKPASGALYGANEIDDWVPTLNLEPAENFSEAVENNVEITCTEDEEVLLKEIKQEVIEEDIPNPIYGEEIEFIEMIENEGLLEEFKTEIYDEEIPGVGLQDEQIPVISDETVKSPEKKSTTLNLDENTCRMCLENDSTKPKNNVFHIINNYKISDMIMCILNISFQQNDPYLSICENCTLKIDTMFKWYNFFLNNNSKLKTFLKPTKKRIRPQKSKIVDKFSESIIPIIQVSNLAVPIPIEVEQNIQDINMELPITTKLIFGENMILDRSNVLPASNALQNVDKSANVEEDIVDKYVDQPSGHKQVFRPTILKRIKLKKSSIKILEKLQKNEVTNLTSEPSPIKILENSAQSLAGADLNTDGSEMLAVKTKSCSIGQKTYSKKDPLVDIENNISCNSEVNPEKRLTQTPNATACEPINESYSNVIEEISTSEAITADQPDEPFEPTTSTSNLVQSKKSTVTEIDFRKLTPIRLKKVLKRPSTTFLTPPAPEKNNKLIKTPNALMKFTPSTTKKVILKMQSNGKLVKMPINILKNKARQVVVIKKKNSESEKPKILGLENMSTNEQPLEARFLETNEAANIVQKDHDYSNNMYMIVSEIKKKKPKIKKPKKPKKPKPPKLPKPRKQKTRKITPKRVLYWDPPLKCFICNEVKETEEQFDDHLKIHQENPPYRCDICETTSVNVQKWNSHMKVHDKTRPFGCEICKLRYYTTKCSLRTHVEQKHGVGFTINKTTYVCSYCGRLFMNKQTLVDHEGSHTGNPRERTESCRFCDKKFYKGQQKDRHELSHSQFKPHKCEECGKTFKTSYVLKIHMELHASEKPILCDFCPKKFAYEVSKRRHVKDYHVRPQSRPGYRNIPTGFPMTLKGTNVPSMRNSNMRCPICDSVYRTNKEVIDHIESLHPDNELEFIYCPETSCDAKFLTKNVATLHKHYKHSSFKCRFCPEVFISLGKRDTHENSHKEKVPCPKCNKMFTSLGYLKVHLKFTHSEARNYECQYCDRKFKKSCEKTCHERIHTGEKPYVCDTCGKAFSDGSTLIKHNKMHANNKVKAVEKTSDNKDETSEEEISSDDDTSN